MRSTRGRGFPTHVLIPSWKLLACAAGACACSPNTNPTAVCSASLRRTCVEAASAPFGAAVRAHEVGPCVAHTRTYREPYTRHTGERFSGPPPVSRKHAERMRDECPGVPVLWWPCVVHACPSRGPSPALQRVPA